MKTRAVALAAIAALGLAGCGADDEESVAPATRSPLEPYPSTGVTKTFDFTIDEGVAWEVGPGAIYNATTYNKVVPGPAIEVNAGDRVVIHLTNHGTQAYSVHTHVSDFDLANDGAEDTLTMPGDTRTYEWNAFYPGTFPYHDHGMGAEGGDGEGMGMTHGLFGAVVVHAPGEAPADEHVVVLADFDTSNYKSLPGVADPETGEFPEEGTYRGGHEYMHTINGKGYTDAVPPFKGKVGNLSRWRVVSIGREFHTWHIHGHRWINAAGELTDNIVLGPAMYSTFDFVEDNPGQWLCHCHVPDHMSGGMMAYYDVAP